MKKILFAVAAVATLAFAACTGKAVTADNEAVDTDSIVEVVDGDSVAADSMTVVVDSLAVK